MDKRFWNFIENPDDTEEVELRIDGDIVMDDDFWTWLFGSETITPKSFRAELEQYKNKNITVWINSSGGDVFAASQIYTALREHKGKVTVKIDGVALSAASVVAMAGQEVYMSPTSIMMIHNPWGYVQGEAKDLRHGADILDEVKETIINAYQLKTGKSRAKISKMMDEETWMSAKKALNEGFIDGMLYATTDSQPEPVQIENSFMFNRLAIQNKATESIKRFIEQCKKISDEKEDVSLEIQNIKELRQQYPELCSQLEEEARAAERQRIKEIDEISATIALELVNRAKYEQPMSAQELAFESLKLDAAKGRQDFAVRTNELKNSGADQVKPSITTKDEGQETVLAEKVAAAANAKRNKGVK